MKAVIMAGGLGTRLKPLTETIPKPLLPVGQKSIIGIIVERLKATGFEEIILAVGSNSGPFETYFGDGSKFGVKVSYSKEEKPLGTAGPLSLLSGKLADPFLVMNGDILTNLDFSKLADFHKQNNADLTVSTKIIQLPLQYGAVESRGKEITDLKEKPSIEAEVNAGIYFFSPKLLELIPKEKAFNMNQLIKDAIKEKMRVLKYQLKDYWLDIGIMSHYEKANRDFGEGVLKDA